VRIDVDRKGGALAQVDLRVDEQDRPGALPPEVGLPDGPGAGGPAPGIKNDPRSFRINKPLVTLPAGRDFTEINLSAGLLFDRPRITLRVEVLGRPADPLGPLPGGGPQGGGPIGGAGDAPAGGPGIDLGDGR